MKKCSHPECDRWANYGIVRKASGYTFKYCTNKHAMQDYERRIKNAEQRRAAAAKPKEVA